MTTKKLTLLAVALAALTTLFAGCEKYDARNIDQLPENAKAFIETNFPADAVSYIYILYVVDGLEKSYHVRLNSDIELDFFTDGTWKEVDCQYAAVPTAIIPTEIANYVTAHFPSNFITQITKTILKRYHVELNNDLELVFSNDGVYIGIDD